MTTGAPGTFGAQLKALRETAGFTQEELATIAGLSVHAVSALERGERRRPHVETLRALIAALESGLLFGYVSMVEGMVARVGRELGGNGLGLAIAKRLAERYQGTLSIRSKELSGTTVTVSLPCLAKEGKPVTDTDRGG